MKHDGRDVDVVAQASKHGFLFVLERDTGRPLWPIEERPVPQSDVPGEQTSPTQPFPTLPPPFARQSFTEKDVNSHVSAESQTELRDLLRRSVNKGLFTPPSLQGSIQMPGNSGGALVDAQGRLIGINSVIMSIGSGLGGQAGSIGLGFAIPSNQAKGISAELLEAAA